MRLSSVLPRQISLTTCILVIVTYADYFLLFIHFYNQAMSLLCKLYVILHREEEFLTLNNGSVCKIESNALI